MPLAAEHEWSETNQAVTVRVLLRRVDKKTIDVTVYDCFLRVSSPPHLFEVDLKYSVDDLAARYVVEDDCTVRVTLPKMTEGLVWGELADTSQTKQELRQRRLEAEQRSQEAYTQKLLTRKDQKGKEEKRFFHEHWDLEKQQRKDIEKKMSDEKGAVNADLAQWQDDLQEPASQPAPAAEPGSAQAAREALEAVVERRQTAGSCGKAPLDKSALKQKMEAEAAKREGEAAKEPGAGLTKVPDRPVPRVLDTQVGKEERADRWKTATERYQASQAGEIRAADKEKIFGPADVLPQPREGGQTTTVEISFTPTNLVSAPQRQKDDDEIYRRSRYKPKDLKDTPLHFKELGDKLCSQKQWKQAADAYSEALKRDTCFLSALNNRAVCWLRLHRYIRAIEDCTLALNMLQSMPAANTTGDRFRAGMMKLHARRGAALCWHGKLREGLRDYEMAEGYSVGDVNRADIIADVQAVRETLRARGEMTESEVHPLALRKSEADRLLSGMGGQKYQEAYDMYTEILEEQPDYWDVLANRVAACLYLRKFSEAVVECDKIIAHCQHVAGALAQGGVGQLAEGAQDSDDDEEEEGLSDDDSDEGQAAPAKSKRRASKLVKSNTSGVYMLLKAYIRKGAALCGKKDFRGAYEHFELALRIVPYDDDLRWDAEQLRQKLQMHNVIAAATGKERDLQ